MCTYLFKFLNFQHSKGLKYYPRKAQKIPSVGTLPAIHTRLLWKYVKKKMELKHKLILMQTFLWNPCIVFSEHILSTNFLKTFIQSFSKWNLHTSSIGNIGSPSSQDVHRVHSGQLTGVPGNTWKLWKTDSDTGHLSDSRKTASSQSFKPLTWDPLNNTPLHRAVSCGAEFLAAAVVKSKHCVKTSVKRKISLVIANLFLRFKKLFSVQLMHKFIK